MKKLTTLIFLTGLFIAVKIYSSSECIKEKRYLKFFVRKPGTHWTYPLTHREQHFWVSKYNPEFSLAKNYIVIDKKDLARIDRAGTNTLVFVEAIKEKTNGEYEYWNQFINGYVSEKNFNDTMHIRKFYDRKAGGLHGDEELIEKEIRSLTDDLYENSKESILRKEYKSIESELNKQANLQNKNIFISLWNWFTLKKNSDSSPYQKISEHAIYNPHYWCDISRHPHVEIYKRYIDSKNIRGTEESFTIDYARKPNTKMIEEIMNLIEKHDVKNEES